MAFSQHDLLKTRLWDRKKAQISKSSNYKIRIMEVVGLEIFKTPENFVRISKSLNETISN